MGYDSGRTIMTITARTIAATATKMAPLKRAIRVILRRRPMRTAQRRGRGMERR